MHSRRPSSGGQGCPNRGGRMGRGYRVGNVTRILPVKSERLVYLDSTRGSHEKTKVPRALGNWYKRDRAEKKGEGLHAARKWLRLRRVRGEILRVSGPRRRLLLQPGSQGHPPEAPRRRDLPETCT